MAEILIVFDFDKTIIDCDSDNWVVDELGATELFDLLHPTMGWNSLMDLMMKELHSRGKSVDEIVEVLKRVPIHPQIVPAIQSVHALGCELRIVSDANPLFIDTILKHNGIRDCFAEINTNPCFVDEEGRLRILPYHHDHGCSLCPPNLCKGLVIERFLASESVEGKKFIYVGDGIGDYCPSLKLRKGDYVMPRKNFPMWEQICSNLKLVKAEIQEWSDGEELNRVLLQLTKKILIEVNSNKSSHLISSKDCKLHTISVSTHEALPQALKIPS